MPPAPIYCTVRPNPRGGQSVYGGHTICDILEPEQGEYMIYITKNNEVLPWKKFNHNMAIAVEFDLEYSE